MRIQMRYVVRLILISLLLPLSVSAAHSSEFWFYCTTFNDKMQFNISKLFYVKNLTKSIKREQWVRTDKEFERYTKGEVGICRIFDSEEEALAKFMSTPNRIPHQEWTPSWMQGHQSKASSDTTSRDNTWEVLFSIQVSSIIETALERWENSVGGISAKGDYDVVAVIVQLALIKLGFDPGPVDGHFDQKTVSAITEWRILKGKWQDGIVQLVAEILWEALVLDGYDPGPANEILSWLSVTHIKRDWESIYYTYTYGIGKDGDDNEPSRRSDLVSGERNQTTVFEELKAVPDALHCVSLPRSESGNFQFFRNNCNYKIVAQWCYENRRDEDKLNLCDPGPPGLDYVRSPLQDHPVFYQVSEALGPHETNGQILPLGAIRFIACGKDHIEDATIYKMEWDVHTGRFRCLAFFPGPEDPRDPERAVQ